MNVTPSPPAGHVECITALLLAGAQVDRVDAKAQTPLFVALVNEHWAAARLLLEAGAAPGGSTANLCSPLSILCQRGHYEGVKVFCSYPFNSSFSNYCIPTLTTNFKPPTVPTKDSIPF